MSVGDDTIRLLEASEIEDFEQDLIKLCKDYGAVLFARKDSHRGYISLQIGEFWIDYTRIDVDGATRYRGL